jgi:hypothetical protein
VATQRAWACQRTMPMRRRARELEARQPHAVSARKEEAEVLHEALSPGAWRRHRGGTTTLIAVDRRSRATQRLGGNAGCQRFPCEATGEGMRRQLTEAWMEHLGMGVAGISPAGSATRSKCRWAAVTGCHDAPQPTRQLKVARGHTIILVARGGDRWMARRWESGQRQPAVLQQRKGTGLSITGVVAGRV